jgi:serine/threonine protein kinase
MAPARPPSTIDVNLSSSPEALLPTLAPGSRPTVAASPNSINAAPVVPNPSAPVIPGYQLFEILGKGGMGEVWRAQQSSLKRTVALKLLPPKLAADREFVARFEKEAAALAALRHANIIQIIDRGVAGESYYIVMEFVPGKSLRDLLVGASRPTPLEALKLALQIARAIEHAHEQHIVHRDLKPENILIDEKQQVKVADFGLAGMQRPGSGYNLTATSVAMGTVNYMAPEQRRDAKNVDHRADLYSFGVVLYELLTGDLPVGRFRLPSQRVKGLDARVDVLVEKLLDAEPEGRPKSAAEVVAVLESLVSLTPSSLPPTEASSSVPSLATAKPESVLEKSWSGFKVLLMFGGAVGLFILVMQALPNASKPQPAPQRAPAWYADTDDEVFALASTGDGLKITFGPGEEEINAHAGVWKLEDSALSAVQYGNQVGNGDAPKLVPRAYLAHRYYSADKFKAEVDMQIQPLGPEFPPLPPDTQRYGELSFRIKELQVSVFAIPDVGMRLMWRYFVGGKEISGNSAQDLENMVADEVPVPPSGKFRLGLELTKGESGAVDVVARVNGQTIAHKVLPALAGQTGKIALGCRNLACKFTGLEVKGKEVQRPATKE